MSGSEPTLARFLRGDIPAVCVEPDGHVSVRTTVPVALLPGSFNPIHAGHWRLADVASRLIGDPVAFELSVVNVDKPPLTEAEVRGRKEQFAGRVSLWLTRAPTFAEKAVLFSGVQFVVGADTAARLVAPRYYQDSEARMAEALDAIRRHGCRFLVAGRMDERGRFVELDHVGIPDRYRDLFAAISCDEFRVDLSSTQLREQARNNVAVASAPAQG
jgi:nicotinic acid mononucleotide adenylyltransferase